MIERLASPSEFIVAFKRNETDNGCPLKKFPLVLNSTKSEWLVNKTIYSLEFYSDDPYFYFNYTVSICPENSILSTRVTSNGTFYVCLEVRFFSDGICWLYEDAQKLCSENNGMGLTGHFQLSEFDYFSKRMINNSKYNEEYLPKSMNGMPETTWQLGIFIDGRSLDESNPKNFEFEDKTHEGIRNYQFFGGTLNQITVPIYILIVTYADIPSTLDARCTSDDFPPCNGNYYCPRGAACRVLPSIIH
ncbi:CW domain-containing protein [Caenorhabditis elegans]|uniref:CW domain-containing protein n=1 Tax=Caenorhabditis elegans TaxID=6239 RepID=O62451_CAEEL|nr:CW domain-containing protein [Caenorhabditis elegans]CAA16375.2 CW domain-containing protein [Caenorhabditis elegans]|eukprot:NP_507987.2 Uncharacterized protein CELE_Y44A6B.3 [Caenorhabditis elegans]